MEGACVYLTVIVLVSAVAAMPQGGPIAAASAAAAAAAAAPIRPVSTNHLTPPSGIGKIPGASGLGVPGLPGGLNFLIATFLKDLKLPKGLDFKNLSNPKFGYNLLLVIEQFLKEFLAKYGIGHSIPAAPNVL